MDSLEVIMPPSSFEEIATMKCEINFCIIFSIPPTSEKIETFSQIVS